MKQKLRKTVTPKGAMPAGSLRAALAEAAKEGKK